MDESERRSNDVRSRGHHLTRIRPPGRGAFRRRYIGGDVMTLMATIAAKMSDAQMKALAEYTSGLR